DEPHRRGLVSARRAVGPRVDERCSSTRCRSGVASRERGPQRCRMLSRLQAAAAANGGLFTRKQALAAGVSSQRLTELVRRGVLARVARGVYAAALVVVEAHDPV